MKRYHTYKDSGVEWIGKVPEHWEVKRLKYVATINPSKENSKVSKDSDELVTFLPMEKVNEDGTFAADLKRPINELWNGFTYFEELDTIFAKITPCFENGKGAYLINLDSSVGFGSTEFHVLREIANTSISKYLYYITRFDLFRKTGESLMIGVAGQKRVPSTFAENFLVGVPPVLEQQSITAYLDHKTTQIDNLISKKQKLIELLKDERGAIINQAVTKGLNPDAPMKDSGIEWLGEVPEHWEVKRLKWLIKGKLKYGANEATELTDESLPRYIRITDFDDDGTLRIETFKSLPFEIAKDYLLHDGDILFARSGATVGKTFLYQNYKGIACYAGYLIKASVNRELILSNFLYYYTKSNAYENWKNSVFIQATIQNIGADKYQMLNVPQPPMNEQVSIVKNIDKKTTKIDQTTTKIEKQIDLLKEFRTALISEVVTGKIDVRDEGSDE